MKGLTGIFLATAVALAGAAAAVFALGDRSMMVPPPEAEVENFVRQLATGRFERAMPHLSRRAAARTSPDSLRAGFRALEARIGRVRDVRGEPLAQRGDTAYAEAVLDAERARALPLPFRLVRESGVWTVDDLTALERPQPIPVFGDRPSHASLKLDREPRAPNDHSGVHFRRDVACRLSRSEPRRGAGEPARPGREPGRGRHRRSRTGRARAVPLRRPARGEGARQPGLRPRDAIRHRVVRAAGSPAGRTRGVLAPAFEIVGVTSRAPDTVEVKGPRGKLALHTGEDLVVVSGRQAPRAAVEDAEIVFAGYGITAPEKLGRLQGRGRGKVLLVLGLAGKQKGAPNRRPLRTPVTPSELRSADGSSAISAQQGPPCGAA